MKKILTSYYVPCGGPFRNQEKDTAPAVLTVYEDGEIEVNCPKHLDYHGEGFKCYHASEGNEFPLCRFDAEEPPELNHIKALRTLANMASDLEAAYRHVIRSKDDGLEQAERVYKDQLKQFRDFLKSIGGLENLGI